MTVRNLTFNNGNQRNGGAIYAEGSAVTYDFPIKLRIENVSFTNNSATATANNSLNSEGGAVYLENVEAAISDSTFENNSVTRAGLTNARALGGAIYAEKSSLKVDLSTFNFNVADQSGGAIYVTDSYEFMVTDSTFLLNDALDTTSSNSGGGAIYANSWKNASATGVSGVPGVISGSYFNSNSSGEDGGAIRIQPRGARIYNNTFYLNTAGDTGGAIYAWGAQIAHITAVQNTASTRGGGVYLIFSDTRVDNSILSNNNPDDCAASSSDFILVRDSLVRTNSPEIDGMIDYNCNVTAENGNIQNQNPRTNTPADNGGPTFTASISTARIPSPALDAGNPASCHVADQRGRLRRGGACDMGAFESNSTVSCAAHDGTTEYVSADSSAVQNAVNSAPASGTVKIAGYCKGVNTVGTVSVVTQTVYIDKLITLEGGYHPISWTVPADPVNNVTTLDAAQLGRVIHIPTLLILTLRGLTIQNGFASPALRAGRGGGIYISGASALTLDQMTIDNNGGFLGGGLYAEKVVPLIIIDSTFSNNYAFNRGAGIYASDSEFTISRSTFVRNVGANSGAIHHSAAQIVSSTIENSTISNNIATTRASILRNEGTGANLTLNHVTAANNAGMSSDPTVLDSGISNRAAMTVTNSIIAYTSDKEDCSNLGGTAFIRNTLIEDGSCGVTDLVNGNRTGDPKLYALAYDADRGSFELDENGALTQSHALQQSSPVVGGGNPSYCTATDQISNARGAGACDMGSREGVEIPTAVGLGSVSAENTLHPTYSLITLSLMILGTAVARRRR